MLRDLGLAARDQDVLRRGRPTWRIADPLLQVYAAVLRPNWELVERGDPSRLLPRIGEPWRAQVLGPHFETLTREWMMRWADPATLGGQPDRVGRTVVSDPRGRSRHEVGLVGVQGGRVIVLGEAKLRAMDVDDLTRLQGLAALLPDAQSARVFLASACGFSGELRAQAPAAAAELVDLTRLYAGS